MSKKSKNQTNKIKLNNVITIYNDRKKDQQPEPEPTPEEIANQKLQEVQQINRIATSQLNNPINQRYNQIADMQRNDQRDNIGAKLEERLKGVISNMDNPRFMSNYDAVNQQREYDLMRGRIRVPLNNKNDDEVDDDDEDEESNADADYDENPGEVIKRSPPISYFTSPTPTPAIETLIPDIEILPDMASTASTTTSTVEPTTSSSSSSSSSLSLTSPTTEIEDGIITDEYFIKNAQKQERGIFVINKTVGGMTVGLSSRDSIYIYDKKINNFKPMKEITKTKRVILNTFIADGKYKYPESSK
jgi:hypothetical protein